MKYHIIDIPPAYAIQVQNIVQLAIAALESGNDFNRGEKDALRRLCALMAQDNGASFAGLTLPAIQLDGPFSIVTMSRRAKDAEKQLLRLKDAEKENLRLKRDNQGLRIQLKTLQILETPALAESLIDVQAGVIMIGEALGLDICSRKRKAESPTSSSSTQRRRLNSPDITYYDCR
ncbi:MAG: hypothetical protein Q9166_001021 [cf. Caloplaca sp. 2 TL-2023]